MSINKLEESAKNPLEQLVNFHSLKLLPEKLSERQRQFAHLIDPRFFEGNLNPSREGKSKKDYSYITPIELEKDLFYLHPLMDPSVLEQGNVRRFPSGVNEKYIAEKYFEDQWVSEGNNLLSRKLESYILANLAELERKDRIKLVDIGPCGGAITTLFALKALEKYGLLEKVEVSLLDIVPNVLEATLLGKYHVPNELLEEYGLGYAGKDGENYKSFLSGGVLHGVKEWYESGDNPLSEMAEAALKKSGENKGSSTGSPDVHYYRGDGETLPLDIRDYDIVLSAYTHHHMNLYGRKSLCLQMEQAACDGGFIGIADFFVPSYEDYLAWYKPHFEKYGDAPPVECPLVDGQTLASWFEQVEISEISNIEKSFVFGGVKK